MSVQEYPVIWLQAATCTGCSVSVLNAAYPHIKNVLLDEVLPGKHINLRYHATIMAGQGAQVIGILEAAARSEGGYLLIVEGAITGGDKFGRLGEVPLGKRVYELSRKAAAVIALGTCAAYGGIPAAKPNPTGARGVGDFLRERGVSVPVINIPGCPPHPAWFTGTVASILANGLPKEDELDDFRRPLSFYGQLIHEHCPRRAAFNEGKFAKRPGEPGCLYELGCKGPITYADCPNRLWNRGVNWCIGNGAPCQGCTQPEFPDLLGPFYEKITDVALPVIGEYWEEREKE